MLSECSGVPVEERAYAKCGYLKSPLPCKKRIWRLEDVMLVEDSCVSMGMDGNQCESDW